jgi:predicted amidohydrolase
MSRTLRIGIHQAEPGSGITVRERDAYREAGVEILVLPEYFWVRPGDRDHHDAARHYEEDLGDLRYLTEGEDWVVVGGTVVEPRKTTFHNACPVFHRGEEIGRYRKIHLMPGEARHGITPGGDFVVLETLGLRLDVLYPDTFERVAALDSDVILAPMSSPFRPGDTMVDKDARDREIFLRGAASAGAPIVKAGGMGRLFGRPLQGRCLVATPQSLVFRTPFEEEASRHAWIVDVPLTP